MATGGLSPADIAAPLRAILSRQKNVRVLQAEAVDVDTAARAVRFEGGDELAYDYLVVATGATHAYFGHDDWASSAPGLKTVEDATGIRARILNGFERAERETDPSKREALLTFVVVGGGPTGVELAGAIGELAHYTLRNDFRSIDPMKTRVILLEAVDRLLLAYPPELAERATESLASLGVTVRTNCKVTSIEPGKVVIDVGGSGETLHAETVLWAAGVQASPLGRALVRGTTVNLDRAGRVPVEADLSLAGHREIFVIGDLAKVIQDGEMLPGIAPVAMQQARYVARAIQARIRNETVPPFRYRDRGNLAVIGRARAVALIGGFSFWGYPAWLLWLFVHLMYLVAFENRLIVFLQWAWSYFTRNRRARLITRTGDDAS